MRKPVEAADKRHICAEIEYDTKDGRVHSDICGFNTADKDWRETLHTALDEWLDKSNGTGVFYVGNQNLGDNDE